MDIIKKYWWCFLLALIAIPILINFVLLIPAFTPIVGNESIWLNFFAVYIGSITTSIISFCILYKTLQANHEENERNRLFQNNILRCQIDYNNLNKFKDVCNIFCNALNYNTLIEICNIFILKGESPLNIIKQSFSNVAEANRLRQFHFVTPSDELCQLIDEQTKVCRLYEEALLDCEVIVSYMNSKSEIIRKDIINDIHASDKLKCIISKNILSLNDEKPKEWLDKILGERLSLVDQNFMNETWSLISKVYLNETKRLSITLDINTPSKI